MRMPNSLWRFFPKAWVNSMILSTASGQRIVRTAATIAQYAGILAAVRPGCTIVSRTEDDAARHSQLARSTAACRSAILGAVYLFVTSRLLCPASMAT